MWRGDNVGGLGEHVTCHLFGFLLHFLLRNNGPILMIHTSYDLLPRKDMHFGVALIVHLILGVKSLKTL